MKITLEQWQAFKAVIDEGSFAKAAEALNKSQSSVSYTLSKLQEQLPVPALVQKGRKAELTDAGKVLYRHATNLLFEAEQLESTAAYLASGWEAEVVIAVDALIPLDKVFCGLQDFSDISPNTRIRLLETSLSGTDEALLTRSADIALSPRVPPGFLAEPIGMVTMIPVAAQHHPLARKTAINEHELKRYRQIVIRDSGTRREQNAGWLGADQRWTVSYFATSVEALKAGLGFAFIPKHRVQSELADGSLVPLALETGGSREASINLILAAQNNAGPAVKEVANCLLNTFKSTN